MKDVRIIDCAVITLETPQRVKLVPVMQHRTISEPTPRGTIFRDEVSTDGGRSWLLDKMRYKPHAYLSELQDVPRLDVE